MEDDEEDDIDQADDFKDAMYSAIIKAEKEDPSSVPGSGHTSMSTAGPPGRGAVASAGINLLLDQSTREAL